MNLVKFNFYYSCPVNVEPILFLVMCGFGLMTTNNSLFTYWARCVQIAQTHRELADNATYTCASIASSNGTLQDDVEKDIANTKIYLQVGIQYFILINYKNLDNGYNTDVDSFTINWKLVR